LVNIVVALSGSDWKLDRYHNGCLARFLTPLLSRLGAADGNSERKAHF
jgi:hypothetical protein